MKDIKTQNFKLSEIYNRPIDDLTHEEIFMAGVQAGALEIIRDILSAHEGKDIGIEITSGYRSLEENLREYKSQFPKGNFPKSAYTSNHIWRLENGYVRTANDFKPIGMSVNEAYEVLETTLTSEFYKNVTQGILHFGFQGRVAKKPWIQ